MELSVLLAFLSSRVFLKTLGERIEEMGWKGNPCRRCTLAGDDGGVVIQNEHSFVIPDLIRDRSPTTAL